MVNSARRDLACMQLKSPVVEAVSCREGSHLLLLGTCSPGAPGNLPVLLPSHGLCGQLLYFDVGSGLEFDPRETWLLWSFSAGIWCFAFYVHFVLGYFAYFLPVSQCN